MTTFTMSLLLLTSVGVVYVGAGYMPMLQTLWSGISFAGCKQTVATGTAEQRRLYEALNRPLVVAEPAQIYTLAVNGIKGCFVRFFYYPASNVVMRSVWMPSVVAAKKMHAVDGAHQIMPLRHSVDKNAIAAMRRWAMADVTLEGSWVSKQAKLYEYTVQECKKMLATLEEDSSKPTVTKRATTKVHEVAQMVVLPPEDAPVLTAMPGNAVHESKPTPVGDTHVGKMVWHGYAKFPNQKEEGKNFACYALDIKYDDGSTNRLKGTDLQRAIESAGVTRSDRVKVYKVKELPPNVAMYHDGEPQRGKILWHIEKL